jgi:acyl-CoA hydrolase
MPTYIVRTEVLVKNIYTLDASSMDLAIEAVREDPEMDHTEEDTEFEIVAAFPQESEPVKSKPKAKKRKRRTKAEIEEAKAKAADAAMGVR